MIDNIQCPTFQFACKLHILKNNKHWDFTLEEAPLNIIYYGAHVMSSLWCIQSLIRYKENFSKNIKFDIYRQKLHYDPAPDVGNKFLVKVKDSVLDFGGKNLLEYGFP